MCSRAKVEAKVLSEVADVDGGPLWKTSLKPTLKSLKKTSIKRKMKSNKVSFLDVQAEVREVRSGVEDGVSMNKMLSTTKGNTDIISTSTRTSKASIVDE